jgi:hypothetical protein
MDRIHRPPADDADRFTVGRFDAARRVVTILDEQPVLPVLAGLAAHAHQVPDALETLAVQTELQLAGAIARSGIADGLPRAAVPQHHRAAAVLAGRNDALEAAVLDRVILDVDGEAFRPGLDARALGDGPAFQRAVEFQPEIEVEPARCVLLHDVQMGGAGTPAAWLARGFEVSFLR